MNSLANHTYTAPSARMVYNPSATARSPHRYASINRTAAKPMGDVSDDDRLYVSLSLQGNKIAELSLVGMTSLSDIIAQLRYLADKYRGLAQMYIRNITAGWSMHRPLMLYR